jgi:hypothetical protein
MVAWQKIALGRVHAGKTVTITVSDTTLTVACEDGPRIFPRTNDHAITRIKAHRPPNVNARSQQSAYPSGPPPQETL